MSATPPVFAVQATAVFKRDDQIILQVMTQARLVFEFQFDTASFWKLVAEFTTGRDSQRMDPHKPPHPSD